MNKKAGIISCNYDHIDELVEFAFNQNNKHERSSQFLSKAKTSIKEEFLQSVSNNRIFSFWKNYEIVGVLNYYLDILRNAADCTLLIDSNKCEYNSVANLLFDKVKRLNDVDTKYNFFFPKENIECANFLESINATVYGNLIITR